MPCRRGTESGGQAKVTRRRRLFPHVGVVRKNWAGLSPLIVGDAVFRREKPRELARIWRIQEIPAVKSFSVGAASTFTVSSAKRWLISTQKLPEGFVVIPGFRESTNRWFPPIYQASARNLGSKAIVGGRPSTVTGTWRVAPTMS